MKISMSLYPCNVYCCLHFLFWPSWAWVSALLCPTLCDPMNTSLQASSVHGILQARILEWAAVPSSRGSSWPRDWTCISYVSGLGRQVFHHSSHLISLNSHSSSEIGRARHTSCPHFSGGEAKARRVWEGFLRSTSSSAVEPGWEPVSFPFSFLLAPLVWPFPLFSSCGALTGSADTLCSQPPSVPQLVAVSSPSTMTLHSTASQRSLPLPPPPPPDSF